MRNIHDVQSYEIKSGDRFVFDANVWIYLTFPISDYDFEVQKIYSKIFADIIKGNNNILITDFLLSEYFNRCMKLHQKLYNESNTDKITDYKKFRKTEFAKSQIKVLISEIQNQVLHWSILESMNYKISVITEILNNSIEIDFNDSLLVDFCKKHNLKLITNDSDFKSVIGIDIITTNL